MSYTKDQIESYASSLAKVASLSNLFSESKVPFLHYRTTEYIYSRVFGGVNFARSDMAIDVKIGDKGIGIKTFVYSGKPKFEKIAEFNKELSTYNGLSGLDKIKRVSELRNKRIEAAGRITGVNTYMYHCIARMPGRLFVFEDEMPFIDADNLNITKESDTTISFTDGAHRYKFSLSKSTLFKEFFGRNSLFEKPVHVSDDLFKILSTIEVTELPAVMGCLPEGGITEEFIILPLYSYLNDSPYVYEGSGLNLWNADGRKRNPNEVYIPIPVSVRKRYPGFLPDRNTPFDLKFPNGNVISMKVSQAGGKALMSQHNADLGEWLLREVLKVPANTLVTYEMLEEIGIDSVEISKLEGEYYIDFKKLGSYEEFMDGTYEQDLDSTDS